MSTLKLTLKNNTDFDVKFLIGKKSFTLAAKQISKVSVRDRVSIEARPILFGVNSSFILGGLNFDSIIICNLEKDTIGNKHKLALNSIRKP